MTGDLVISKTTPRVQLYQAAGVAVSLGINGAKLAVRNETNAALTQAQAATPLVAEDVATKGYVDTADGTKAASVHTHDYSPSAHTHAYMPTAGGTFTGRVQIDTGAGITLHNPGDSVVSMGAQLIGGRYCLEVTDGWDGNSGDYAPIQAGTPINGSSAVTVDWVRGDRAAVSHGSHPASLGTTVFTSDANGQAFVGAYVGATVVQCNGDFTAHARAVSLRGDFGPGGFGLTNMNANAATRCNWIAF